MTKEFAEKIKAECEREIGAGPESAPDTGVPDPPTEPTPLTLSYQMYDPANGKRYKILLQEIV